MEPNDTAVNTEKDTMRQIVGWACFFVPTRYYHQNGSIENVGWARFMCPRVIAKNDSFEPLYRFPNVQ